MRRKKQKKQIKLIHLLMTLVIIVFILLLTGIYSIFEGKHNNEVEKTEESNVSVVIDSEEILKSSEDDEFKKLIEMKERDRIEYYISNFIRDIEEKRYQEAYSVLNNDFKKNYFSTIKHFKEYAETKFTTMMDIKYTNFERNGQIYVSWLTMTDAINGGKDSGEEMNFVVKENNFNDFELSFSIK